MTTLLFNLQMILASVKALPTHIMTLDGISTLIAPVLVMCGVGAAAGVLLTIAAKIFYVPTDPKADEVREVLPGVNCGACGYVGCDEYAKAVASGEAGINLCVPGGSAVVGNIASIMGAANTTERKIQIARVRCQGNCNRATEKYAYQGINSCSAAAQLFDGHKACPYGCLGHGDCVRACPFDAIDIVNDIAVINEKKCKSCRKCVAACPKQLIEMVDHDIRFTVLCQSQDRGPQVKKYCTVGCIGCTLCVKACPVDAITMKGALAYIDYTKCTNCGACANVCPTNAIIDIENPPEHFIIVEGEKPNTEKTTAKIDPKSTSVRIKEGADASASTIDASPRPVKDASKLHTIAQTGRLSEEDKKE